MEVTGVVIRQFAIYPKAVTLAIQTSPAALLSKGTSAPGGFSASQPDGFGLAQPR